MNVQELIDKMVQSGVATKAAQTSKTRVCVEITAFKDDLPFFMYIYNGKFSNKYIIKVTSKPSSCMEALVDPSGLYTIPPNIINEKYINKLNEKIKVIIKIHKGQVNT